MDKLDKKTSQEYVFLLPWHLYTYPWSVSDFRDLRPLTTLTPDHHNHPDHPDHPDHLDHHDHYFTLTALTTFTSLADSPGHYVTFIKSPRGMLPVWPRAVPCCTQARGPPPLSL